VATILSNRVEYVNGNKQPKPATYVKGFFLP